MHAQNERSGFALLGGFGGGLGAGMDVSGGI
jgi:hypothetical protein